MGLTNTEVCYEEVMGVKVRGRGHGVADYTVDHVLWVTAMSLKAERKKTGIHI